MMQPLLGEGITLKGDSNHKTQDSSVNVKAGTGAGPAVYGAQVEIGFVMRLHRIDKTTDPEYPNEDHQDWIASIVP